MVKNLHSSDFPAAFAALQHIIGALEIDSKRDQTIMTLIADGLIPALISILDLAFDRGEEVDSVAIYWLLLTDFSSSVKFTIPSVFPNF